jgi:nicotinate-nucleotide adenylyltransferase
LAAAWPPRHLPDGPPLGCRRGPRLYRRLDDAAPQPAPGRTPRAIGLLGGSFNPAHDGHRYISLEAIKRLALDEVWWLVSPQNPLKPRAGMAPFAERMAKAQAVARHPRLRVSDLEAQLGTTYTAETLERLTAMPGQRFIWLIGADNLLQLPQWQHWTRIFRLAPIAVFDRSPYSQSAVVSKAGRRFAHARIAETSAHSLKDKATPAWTYIHLPPHPASSTAIRAGHPCSTSGARVQPGEIRP